MGNVTCIECKQGKKEENFSEKSLERNLPVCSCCDSRILMKKVSELGQVVAGVKKQQQAVIEVTPKVAPKPTKQSPRSRILGILSQSASA